MSSDHVEGTWRVGRLDDTASDTEKVLFLRHMAAYDFALGALGEVDTVLEIACGFGVGLEKVALKARHIIAMDLATSALDSVRPRPGLLKVQADATRMPMASDSVGAVIAFQLIEHVPRQGAIEILREIQRILAPGGKAFVTTPNARWRLLPFQKPWNPYHVEEYRPQAIAGLCRDAGLADHKILGLIGKGGAHEIEIERVRQDPMEVYLRLPKSLRWYARRVRSLVAGSTAAPQLEIVDDDAFSFEDRYEDGLDFMIVINKPANA